MSQDQHELPDPPTGDDHPVFSQPGSPDMVLSGSELITHNLPQARRGFDPAATEALLARAARTIDALYEQVWRAGEEHNETLAALDRAGQQEPVEAPAPAAPESTRILAAAERTASEVVAQANAEAEIIRARAAQERSRGEAEIAEIRRQAQDALRRAQADAAARRAELADEVRDAEVEAGVRMAEARARLTEVDRSFETRRSELEQELARLQASSTRLREELAQQLETFRAHARNERDAAVLQLVELAESVRSFDPSITEVVADGRFAPTRPEALAPSPWAVAPEAPAPAAGAAAPAVDVAVDDEDASDTQWGDAPAAPSWDDPAWTSTGDEVDDLPASWDGTGPGADAPHAATPRSDEAADADRRRLWQAPVVAAGPAAATEEHVQGEEAGTAAGEDPAGPGFRQVDSFQPDGGFTQVPSYDVVWPVPGE